MKQASIDGASMSVLDFFSKSYNAVYLAMSSYLQVIECNQNHLIFEGCILWNPAVQQLEKREKNI